MSTHIQWSTVVDVIDVFMLQSIKEYIYDEVLSTVFDIIDMLMLQDASKHTYTMKYCSWQSVLEEPQHLASTSVCTSQPSLTVDKQYPLLTIHDYNAKTKHANKSSTAQ